MMYRMRDEAHLNHKEISLYFPLKSVILGKEKQADSGTSFLQTNPCGYRAGSPGADRRQEV